MNAPSNSHINETGTWIRWVLLAAGILSAVFVPLNLLAGEPLSALECLAFAFAAIVGFVTMTRSHTRRVSFVTWLYENSSAIWDGTAVYEGREIKPFTVLRRFDTTVSTLIITTRYSSEFVVEGDPRELRTKLVSTFTTLALGWWGVPWGPIFTLMALFRNFRGGHKVTVAEVLGYPAEFGIA